MLKLLYYLAVVVLSLSLAQQRPNFPRGGPRPKCKDVTFCADSFNSNSVTDWSIDQGSIQIDYSDAKIYATLLNNVDESTLEMSMQFY